MAVKHICLLLLFTITLAEKPFVFYPSITTYKPAGLQIIIPDDPRIQFVQYKASFHRGLDHEYFGAANEIIFHKTNGFWMMDKPNITFEIGDIIYCRYFVGQNIDIGFNDNATESVYQTQFLAKGYENNYTHGVNVLDDREPKKVNKKKCFVISDVPGKELCTDDVIFEDNFNTFREDYWQIEQYIPVDHPEYPFISYQKLSGADSTVVVENGSLHIRPKLQRNVAGLDDVFLYAGTLDLSSSCTGRVCKTDAMGSNILPPVVSGRIKSKLAFKYGTVHIRAKLPIGDWIYPEILLEPLSNKYGSLHYSSGVLKMAMVRGNTDVNKPKYSSKILQGGPILNSKCRSIFDFYTKQTADGRSWGDDFHVYSMTWSPGFIELSVDGKTWVTYRPGASGLRSWLPKTCRGPWYKLLDGAPKIAPFDDYFYVSFGVAVGGFSEFPDDLETLDGYKKPWTNGDPKAVYNFWSKRDEWEDTWTQPELIVDYIKIIAI